LVGRQVLGAPALGDIQLSLCYQKGFLEVEVIRARGLQVLTKYFSNFYKILIFNFEGTSRFESAAGAIRESVLGVGQKVHCESENDSSSKDIRSALPTNVAIS
jgi:hypothetical protein